MNAQLTMDNVTSFIVSIAHLLAGWVGLALSTSALRLFPDFPLFSTTEDKKLDVVRRTHRLASRHDSAVRLWVVAEGIFFSLLNCIAALLYCGCRRQRRSHNASGIWYVRNLR